MLSLGPMHLQSTGSAMNLSSSRQSRVSARSSGSVDAASSVLPSTSVGSGKKSLSNSLQSKPKSLNTNQQRFGMSKFISPASGSALYAELEFKPFAPCICCPIVCCQCFVPKAAQKRFYARVYENRIEYNQPWFPW